MSLELFCCGIFGFPFPDRAQAKRAAEKIATEIQSDGIDPEIVNGWLNDAE